MGYYSFRAKFYGVLLTSTYIFSTKIFYGVSLTFTYIFLSDKDYVSIIFRFLYFFVFFLKKPPRPRKYCPGKISGFMTSFHFGGTPREFILTNQLRFWLSYGVWLVKIISPLFLYICTHFSVHLGQEKKMAALCTKCVLYYCKSELKRLFLA